MSANALQRIHHVPRSHLWQAPGRQAGIVHLHVTSDLNRGRLERGAGTALCGERGWYERPAELNEPLLCGRCVEMAKRYGLSDQDSAA